MEYLFVAMAFLAGVGIGISLSRKKEAKPQNTVALDVETFQYLKERDDELWQIEKTERSHLRFISPKLKSVQEDKSLCLN